MAKKTEPVTVIITGPECRINDRLYLPGETATVPAKVAEEWITTERAALKAAEVEDDAG